MKMIKKAKKGFTLIELVVVIAVIAILSGVSVVAYVGITNNAKERACETEASQLRMIIAAEDIDNDKFLVEGTKITFEEGNWTTLMASLNADADVKKDLEGLKGEASVSGSKIIYELNGKTAEVFTEYVPATADPSEVE